MTDKWFCKKHTEELGNVLILTVPNIANVLCSLCDTKAECLVSNSLRIMTIEELNAYIAEYLSTLDDDREKELYATARQYAWQELDDFTKWLFDKIGERL